MKRITTENVFDVLEQLIGEKKNETDEEVVYQIDRFSTNLNVRVNKRDVLEELQELDEFVFDGASLYSKNQFFVAVKSNLFYSRFADKFDVKDDKNHISYQICQMPIKYYLAVMNSLLEEESDIDQLNVKRLGLSRIGMELREPERDYVSFEDLLACLFRMRTIKIESDEEMKCEDFRNLVCAYVFTISYNYNVVYVPQRNVLDLVPKRILRKSRRNSLVRAGEEFDPPRKKYNNELVNHYQMALVSDNPYLEFLSYYHIIEYFFDSVVDDDLIDRVKNKITKPDFSYKRKKDILELVKLITKTTQIKKETSVYNEANALKLVLKKYINLNDLKDDLNSADSNYIEYLKTHKVTFSNANIVNLENENDENVYAELSNRIYSTRNALVHSKELELSKYKPFHDEKELRREILLIGCMAEQIILGTSSDL